MPSDRSFGWTFTGLFFIVGAYCVWRGAAAAPWALALAAFTALVTLARPAVLAPLKRGWMKLGELLHHVVSPVVLGALYFGMFTPIGWAVRLAGRDAMTRRFEPQAPTYWVRRSPPGPRDDSFHDLF